MDLVELGIALLAPVSLWVLWRRGVIGARYARSIDLSSEQERSVARVPWWVCFLCVFVILVSQGLGAGAGVLVPESSGALLRDGVVQLGASAAAAIVGMGLMLALRGGRGAQGGRFAVWPRWSDLKWGALALAAALPLVAAVSTVTVLIVTLCVGEPLPPVAHETLKELVEHRGEAGSWVLVAGAVLGAPLAEEIMFRVFLQSGVLALVRRRGLAVVISATLFAGIHLLGGVPLEQAYAIVPLFVLGIALGWACERTGRVWVPVVMHMGFNLLNVGAALVAGNG